MHFYRTLKQWHFKWRNPHLYSCIAPGYMVHPTSTKQAGGQNPTQIWRTAYHNVQPCWRFVPWNRCKNLLDCATDSPLDFQEEKGDNGRGIHRGKRSYPSASGIWMRLSFWREWTNMAGASDGHGAFGMSPSRHNMSKPPLSSPGGVFYVKRSQIWCTHKLERDTQIVC